MNDLTQIGFGYNGPSTPYEAFACSGNCNICYSSSAPPSGGHTRSTPSHDFAITFRLPL
jgi:hypothetical protein